MTKTKAFAKKHKKLLIVLAVLVILVVLFTTLMPTMPQAGAMTRVDTTVLEKTSLAQVVSASGTVQSTSSRDVTSSSSYSINEVLVAQGDVIEAGQTLATLDTTELEITIKETRESLQTQQSAASLSLNQAQRNLDNAITQRDNDRVKYENAVNEAQSALDEARLAAESEAAAARQNLDAANEARDAAYAAWQQEEANTPQPEEGDEGEALVEPVSNDALLQALWQQYEQAEQAAQQAQQAYDSVAASHEASISMAETALETAKTTRDNGNKQNDQTVQTYQDTVDNQKTSDSTATLRNQLASYERQLENAIITAPISGTVTAVNAVEGAGALSATGALFTIEDTKSLEIPLAVAEYDVNKVAVGMRAEIFSDAADGEEWNGTVTAVSPTANSSGSFTVTVKVSSDVGVLKSGMSAEANILIEEKENVFAVPYDAVTQDESGQAVVYEYLGQAAEGETDRRAVPVTTGMESDYYIEISGEGLAEGMVIMNDPLGVNVSTQGFGMMGMMGGF